LFFNYTATTQLYTLSLHDALPISSHSGMKRNLCEPIRTTSFVIRSRRGSISTSLTYVPFVELWSIRMKRRSSGRKTRSAWCDERSEEHTSELQSRRDLVCRLLLEK